MVNILTKVVFSEICLNFKINKYTSIVKKILIWYSHSEFPDSTLKWKLLALREASFTQITDIIWLRKWAFRPYYRRLRLFVHYTEKVRSSSEYLTFTSHWVDFLLWLLEKDKVWIFSTSSVVPISSERSIQKQTILPYHTCADILHLLQITRASWSIAIRLRPEYFGNNGVSYIKSWCLEEVLCLITHPFLTYRNFRQTLGVGRKHWSVLSSFVSWVGSYEPSFVYP